MIEGEGLVMVHDEPVFTSDPHTLDDARGTWASFGGLCAHTLAVQ